MEVQYESSDMSQQTTVQIGNKGSGRMGNKGKEKKVSPYIGIMTPCCDAGAEARWTIRTDVMARLY